MFSLFLFLSAVVLFISGTDINTVRNFINNNESDKLQ